MKERMSLIVFSGTVDKLMAVSILSTGAAAMGMEVELFLTTWGLEAFRKDNYKSNMKVSKDFEEYAPVMMEQMMVKKVPSWMDTLKGAKEIGDVNIYACSMTMELFGMKLSDLEPIVDEVTGVATFVERAKEGRITLFI
ncbi:MAG: DsrE/DsrF/DrsH-like family protein [Ktedonobacteraceae bacterium]